MAEKERPEMNIAMRAIGAFLVVAGMCILLTSTRVGHRSYTEPYVQIITQQFEIKPGPEDIRLDPKSEPQWHDMIAGTLETYASKVCYESPQNKDFLGMIFQLTGLVLLFTATASRGMSKTS